MQQEFKKVLKGSIHQMKHFLVWQKDLEIFRKFRSESLKILKERNRKDSNYWTEWQKEKDKFWKNFQKCNWQMEENSFHF